MISPNQLPFYMQNKTGDGSYLETTNVAIYTFLTQGKFGKFLPQY